MLDLDGVLLSGGRWARLGGTARLSIVVADVWRAQALAAAYAERGVASEEPTRPAEAGLAVRTAFSTILAEHATRWLRGAREAAPADLVLSAGGLRLWAIAGGRSDESGYLMATASADDGVHRAAGAQLARLGVAAVALGGRGGPGWRITSARRLRRLAELLGPAPDGADWPT